MKHWTIEKAIKVYDTLEDFHRLGKWPGREPDWVPEIRKFLQENGKNHGEFHVLYYALWCCCESFLNDTIECRTEMQKKDKQIREFQRTILNFFGD